MTDQPDFARDEIASAHLDGEPDATDPTTLDEELQARVGEFRAVSEALAEPVPTLSVDQRESMLAAALATADAVDEADDDADDDPVGPPVTPIDAARRRRRVWLPPPAVAAAAIVVIAVIGIGLIVQGQRGNSSNDLSAASASADQSAKSTAGGAADSALAATAPLPDLGTFADKAAFGPLLRTVDVSTLAPPATAYGTESAAGVAPNQASTTSAANDSATTSAPPAPQATTTPESFGPVAPDITLSPASIDRCDQVVMSTDATLGDRLAVATATVDGRAVLVYSHPVKASDPPATRITVADAESCDVVLAVQR